MAATTNSKSPGKATGKSPAKRPGAAPDSPAKIARRIIERISAHDLDGAQALTHDDAVDDFVAVGPRSGKEEIRRFFEELLGAFPDLRIEVARITESKGVAVVEWVTSGTFTGTPFLGIEATGKRVTLRGVDCMEIDGGKLRNNTIYYDGAGFARDVGLLPAMGSMADKGMTAAFNAVTRARRLLGR